MSNHDADRLKVELDYLTGQLKKVKAKARTKAGRRDPGKVAEAERIVAETQAAYDTALTGPDGIAIDDAVKVSAGHASATGTA